MKCITYRIEDDKQVQLKNYCIDHNISMQKLLDDYITTLLSKSGNAGKAPAKEKNSGKNTALTKVYHCPYCGKDITSLIPIDRLNHLQNCKNGHNE